MISALTRRVAGGCISKRETGGQKTIRNNEVAGRNIPPVKLSEDRTYFAGSDTILVFKFFRDVFGGGTRLAMPKTILRAGLIVIEA